MLTADFLSVGDKAKTLADTFSNVLGEELDNVVSDGYIITTDSGVGYEIEIQKAYKGIGIQNVFSSNADDTLFVKGQCAYDLFNADLYRSRRKLWPRILHRL